MVSPTLGAVPKMPIAGLDLVSACTLVGGAPEISSGKKPSRFSGLVHHLQSDVPVGADLEEVNMTSMFQVILLLAGNYVVHLDMPLPCG